MRMLILLLLSLVCCGVVPEIKEVCEQRYGTYSIAWFERSGTCGYVSEQIVHIDSQPRDPNKVNPKCNGWIDYTANNCQVIPHITCTDINGRIIKETGAVDWALDGSTATGIIQLTIYSQDSFVCLSTYDVVYQRISRF